MAAIPAGGEAVTAIVREIGEGLEAPGAVAARDEAGRLIFESIRVADLYRLEAGLVPHLLR